MRLELDTSVPGLVLRQHSVDDASAYHELVQRNRTHLTRYGDYQDEVDKSLAEIEDRLQEPDNSYRLGIWYRDELVGDIALLHQEPPCWGLGYWLSEHATGQGIITTAARALISFAREHLGATEIRAGVTHGNHRSIAALTRLGFTHVTDRENHASYSLNIKPGNERRQRQEQSDQWSVVNVEPCRR